MELTIAITALVTTLLIFFIFFSAIREIYKILKRVRKRHLELETTISELSQQNDDLADEILILKTALLEGEVVSEDALYDVERRVIEIPRAQTRNSPLGDALFPDVGDDDDNTSPPPSSKNIH
ncbi:MAG: hypothetical protein Kow0090_07960 [Myxococcota bacterium]